MIKDLGIDLPVIPAKAKNNHWDTTDNGVSYLLSSPVPGDTGNSIFYAHNWASLFGNFASARTPTRGASWLQVGIVQVEAALERSFGNPGRARSRRALFEDGPSLRPRITFRPRIMLGVR